MTDMGSAGASLAVAVATAGAAEFRACRACCVARNTKDAAMLELYRNRYNCNQQAPSEESSIEKNKTVVSQVSSE
jgi:hypothetical protein